uniref:Uncharacterized protein n=1 Tax=Arundo donax TaxID=35708 RepID=A0A0A9B2X7_ARUDO
MTVHSPDQEDTT